MAATKIDIEIQRGARFFPSFTWMNEDKSPKDISNWEFIMDIRTAKGGSGLLIHRTSSVAGNIIKTNNLGIIRPDIKSSVTRTFEDEHAWYDIVAIPGGVEDNALRIVEGRIKITDKVTRLGDTSFDVYPELSLISVTEESASFSYEEILPAATYEYRLDGGDPVTITDNPFIVTLLDSETTYNIQIRGLDSIGPGPWSPLLEFTTEESEFDAPTSAPNIGDINVGIDNATIFFSGTANSTSYEYRLNGGDVVNIGTTNPFIIEDLLPDSSYLIEMRGRNSEGVGPWSNGVTFLTNKEAPTQTPVITDTTNTDTEITVTYSTIDNADFYEYRINGGVAVSVDEDNPFTIESLTPGTQYQIEVRGRNSGGVSPWSDPVVVVTEEAPQSAPVIASLDDIEEQAFYATVTRSDIPNVDGYEYRLVIGTNIDIGLTNPFDITDLQPETLYNLEIRGYNQWGVGPWSTTYEFTTRAIINPVITIDEPEEDEDIPQGDVTVSGTIFADFDIDVLEYRLNGGAWQALTADNVFSFEVSITDLGNNTVDIRATDTNSGQSVESVTINTTDVTNPVPGGDGVLTTSNITDSGFTIGFTKATDNAYAQSTLVYKLYTGPLEVVTDIDRIEGEGTLMDQGTDVMELSGTGAPGQSFEGSVLVEDPSGNKALYNSFSVALLDPEIEIFETTLTKGQVNGELVGNQFTGDVGDQLVVDWQITPQDGADDEVTVQSLDTNVVTVQSLTQTSAGEGSATLELQGLGELDAAVVRVYPSFYGAWTNTPQDKRIEIQMIRYTYEDDVATESATWTYTTGVA